MTGNLPSGLEEWRRKISPQPPVVPVRPERQCVNEAGRPKTRHHSKQYARMHLRKIKRRPGFTETPGRPLHVYRCPVCHFWHVGKTPKQPPEVPPSSPES